MRTNEKPAATVFFDGCAEGQFLLQKCGAHGHLQYPPGPLCRQCRSPITQWVQAAGEGTVEAFSVVHRAPMPAFNAYLPYMIAVVKLREGPAYRAASWISGAIFFIACNVRKSKDCRMILSSR